MKIRELENIIEKISPLSLQEEWDNSGWQILLKDKEEEVCCVLVAMEVTSAVIEEAKELGADVIVTHHPLIFGSLNKIDRKNVTGNMLAELIKEGISVYSSHTPFDKCAGGNNWYLAKLLRLLDIKAMKTDDTGFCREGLVDGDCTVGEYIGQVLRWLGLGRSEVAFSGDLNREVRKVGLCTGAGGDFIYAAKEAGCDLFITGDVKYHTAQAAREIGLNVLDIGHYGSERIFTENMVSQLRKNLDFPENEKITASLEDIDPFSAV